MTTKRWGNGARVDDLKTGKKLLLKAAIQCFVTKGIKATTIEDIATEANVTRRTVYRYYAGKQDIIAALIDLERQRMFSELTEIVEPLGNDLPRIIEECIVFTARYHPPEKGQSDLVTGANAAEAQPHIATDESAQQWRKLLQKPYEVYCATRSQVGSLDDLIHIIGRLVLVYRQIPTDETSMRASIRAFQTLAPL